MSFQGEARWVAEKLVCGAPVTVGEPDLTELVRAMRRQLLEAGTVLYQPGRKVAGAWIIRSGEVEMSRGSAASRCVLSIHREGDIVGDVYLLLDTPPCMTARCTDRVDSWLLPAKQFRALITRYPMIAAAWSCNLAGRLAKSRDRVFDLIGGTLSQRLARLILAESRDGRLRLPQRTMAQMLGVQRTSVNKSLKDLQQEDVVELGYGSVILKDRDALAAMAARRATNKVRPSRSKEAADALQLHSEPSILQEGVRR